jgi:hypothetical protein
MQVQALAERLDAEHAELMEPLDFLEVRMTVLHVGVYGTERESSGSGGKLVDRGRGLVNFAEKIGVFTTERTCHIGQSTPVDTGTSYNRTAELRQRKTGPETSI